MKKTIYVKSKEVWDRIEVDAKARKISVSELLLSSYSGATHGSVLGELKKINEKLDSLTPAPLDGDKTATTDVPKRADLSHLKQPIIKTAKDVPYFRPMPKAATK